MLARDFCVWVDDGTLFLAVPHGHETASPDQTGHDDVVPWQEVV